jgi:Holliday junction resolvasome RuvABC DNA-binding subunit
VKKSMLARAMAKQEPDDPCQAKIAALVAVGFSQEQAEVLVAALPTTT